MIFKIQKRIIRIIANSNYRTSCRNLFKKLKILPLQSQYILSLAMFVVGNFEEFSEGAHNKGPTWPLAQLPSATGVFL